MSDLVHVLITFVSAENLLHCKLFYERNTVFPSCDVSFIVLFVGSFSDITKLWKKCLISIKIDSWLRVNQIRFLWLVWRIITALTYFFMRNTCRAISGRCSFCHKWLGFLDFIITKFFKHALFLKKMNCWYC